MLEKYSRNTNTPNTAESQESQLKSQNSKSSRGSDCEVQRSDNIRKVQAKLFKNKSPPPWNQNVAKIQELSSPRSSISPPARKSYSLSPTRTNNKHIGNNFTYRKEQTTKFRNPSPSSPQSSSSSSSSFGKGRNEFKSSGIPRKHDQTRKFSVSTPQSSSSSSFGKVRNESKSSGIPRKYDQTRKFSVSPPPQTKFQREGKEILTTSDFVYILTATIYFKKYY